MWDIYKRGLIKKIYQLFRHFENRTKLFVEIVVYNLAFFRKVPLEIPLYKLLRKCEAMLKYLLLCSNVVCM